MNWPSLALNLQEYAYILIGLFCLFLLFALLWEIALKLSKKKEKPFPFTLFLIRIVSQTEEEKEKLASLMEDFYCNLFSAGIPKISLEIARVKDEINFYVSVPKDFESVFKRKILKCFPQARIEKIDKFNIFLRKKK